MGAGNDILAVLARIEGKLDRLLAGGGAQASGGAIADASDLDSQYGDPEVRSDPKDWKGPSQKGKRMSQCPPEFLDLLAGLLEWQAQKDDEQGKTSSSGKPTGPYKRKDAARARGWRDRKRAGWKTPTADQALDAVGFPSGDDAEPPF